MIYEYYKRLTPRQQRIYRQSDHVTAVVIPDADPLAPAVLHLSETLRREDRNQTNAIAQSMVSALAMRLRVPPLSVRVLDARPSHDWGELQGLYSPTEGGRSASVTLWMRTAKRRRVVAFRTFLRTILHEFCHHLDYELLRLGDSLHTEGFYKRESSLFHQLMRARPPLSPPPNRDG